MFDVFKQDIKVGDNVKLYLTTGKEPEGIVISIGDNFVLLESNDKTQNRFFDKLIGGWVVISEKIDPEPIQNISHNKDERKIHTQTLTEKANVLKNLIKQRDILVMPNAEIIEVREKICIASSKEFGNILIFKNKIIDFELEKEINEFQTGEIIPIILRYKIRKGKYGIATAVMKPRKISEYVDLQIEFIKKRDYNSLWIISYFLKNYFPKKTSELNYIINEIKSQTSFLINGKTENNDSDTKTNFANVQKNKKVEIKINDLIRQQKYQEALFMIEQELGSSSIENKYKSSLLLKKAQTFSSINNPKLSEVAYSELIEFNEKINSSSNNLSHLYTELARLQAQSPEKQELALASVKRALTLNPNNNFALSLRRQFEGKTTKNEQPKTHKDTDEHLLIETDDDSTAISKMIDIDIKEHKYTHPDIIRNGGKPTAFVAKAILEEAKNARGVDMSERYPLYLEAAKAFSELNIGSYDLQDYLESVAYYSMLKGNSLFLQFRNSIISKSETVVNLIRLSDSACSYYIESLNLLSNIDSKLLVTILGNYLKLKLAVYHIKKDSEIDFNELFKGNFAIVFKECIKSRNKEIESIAYKVIVDCGASSINAWNSLYYHPNGTKVLYGDFSSSSRTKEIYTLINHNEESNINIELKPGEFLKNIFLNRRNSVKNFVESLNYVLNIELEPHNLSQLVNEWSVIKGFNKFLSSTDIEVKNEIDKIIELLKPYLNRGERERLNILIQSRSIIEKQLRFINENTTFYGRTFFFGLLSKWKKEIDALLEEKVTQSYPQLEISIDPPYYIVTNDEITAPIIIKNNGEATAEGFELNIHCESTVYEDSIDIPYKSDIEIPSGGKIETSFVIDPNLIKDSKAVEIKIDISPVYQKRSLSTLRYEFTIEEEPKSILTYEDIPWRDGPIPSEQLFKGRKKLIADLAQHYLSLEKDKPYILYGLTRTGKSSILEYLNKYIEGDTFTKKGKEILVLTFSWDLSEAASFKRASDFWNYILYQQTFEELEKFAEKYKLNITDLKISESVRAKDFKLILEYLNKINVYPIFFVDEFSFIKTLIDDGTINSAFLHTLRQFSLNELASFVFAGTYDIKTLIRDERYGITGQLVNAIEEQINDITDDAAEELIEVIDDKLSFTPEAIEHIKFLSGRVPYFIQIICKYCGYYASENKRRVIGFPEVEKVMKILIGENPSSSKSLVKKLPENIFQNNQFSPTDPKEVAVLISSIVHFNKNRVTDPRGVGFNELQKLWSDTKISAFRPMLADAINLLKEKKIIIQQEDEGIPVYKLSVDLFRRWWANHHPDINLTLTTLVE